MPFVKLDCAIVDSSLWVDRDLRSLFITALVMAEPFELTRPEPQLHVRSLDETGFVVPPGWYGLVRSAGSGIIRRDGIEAEAGLRALEALGSPDPESRSEAFEGRRLVRIDGGYVVLNYFTYRDKDFGAADRMRRMRERRREGDVSVTRYSDDVTRNALRSYASASASDSESALEVKNEDDEVAVFAKPFGKYADLVEGLVRSARVPLAVMAELNVHLMGEGVPKRSYVEVGGAVRAYLASGETTFKSAYFAGFLRRGARAAEVEDRRRQNTHEQQAIDHEAEERKRAEEEKREEDRLLADFHARKAKRYADLLAMAEKDVPNPNDAFGKAVVRSRLAYLIRQEPPDASS